jgi:hypothetical protein
MTFHKSYCDFNYMTMQRAPLCVCGADDEEKKASGNYWVKGPPVKIDFLTCQIQSTGDKEMFFRELSQ